MTSLGTEVLGEPLGGPEVVAAWTPLSPPGPPAAASSPAGYLNVLVNSQWKSRWCSVRDSHLHFYQDRNRSKVAQQPLSLVGCEVVPDPSPDHLYSFRILHNGEELAKLEVLWARGGRKWGEWMVHSQSGEPGTAREGRSRLFAASPRDLV